MNTETLDQRIAGGPIGLPVGDALGVPYEFHPSAAIPDADLIEYSPPPGFPRSHAPVPPGTWSDDGAQALCLLASPLHGDGLDPDDFGRRLFDGYESGPMAVDGHVFHVGVTTGTALLRAQLCCALYCLVARRPLTESPEPWRDAVAALLQEPLRVRDYRRAQ